MKRACAGRRYWLSVVLILTVALTSVGAVNAQALVWAVESDPGCGVNIANAVAADGTSLYVVGVETHPYAAPGELNARQWRVEKRNAIDSSLVWASAPPDRNTLPSVASGVAVDDSGVYVVGSDSSPSPSDRRWRVEKRSLVDGSPLWNATSNPSLGRNIAYGIAVDDSGIYVVGSDESQGPDNIEWRIEKRHLADGSLVWNATSEPTSGAAEAHAVVADASGIYVVGYDSSTSPAIHEWRIEKRELGHPMPSPTTNVGALLFIVTAVPVGIAFLAVAAISSKRTVHAQGPPHGTGRQPAIACPRCHGGL